MTTNATKHTTMVRTAHQSATCQICRARVIVWKRNGVKATLLRVLALANHVRTLHPALEKD